MSVTVVHVNFCTITACEKQAKLCQYLKTCKTFSLQCYLPLSCASTSGSLLNVRSMQDCVRVWSPARLSISSAVCHCSVYSFLYHYWMWEAFKTVSVFEDLHDFELAMLSVTVVCMFPSWVVTVACMFPSCAVTKACMFLSCAVTVVCIFPSCAVTVVCMFPSCAVTAVCTFPSCAVTVVCMFPSCAVTVACMFQSCAVTVACMFPSCAVTVACIFPNCAVTVGCMFPSCAVTVVCMFPNCQWAHPALCACHWCQCLPASGVDTHSSHMRCTSRMSPASPPERGGTEHVSISSVNTVHHYMHASAHTHTHKHAQTYTQTHTYTHTRTDTQSSPAMLFKNLHVCDFHFHWLYSADP